MSKTTINSKYASALIDAVFGVVIAIPLLDVPEILLSLFYEPSYKTGTRILLLVSSLLFCSFYWLEIHEFLIAQDRLSESLKLDEDHEITSKQSRVFLGGIIMITSIAAVLKYASFELFQEFLIANIVFWIIDMHGTREVKSHYKPYINEIIQKQEINEEVYNWYQKHINSSYYYIYAFTNVLFFSIALMLYRIKFIGNSKFGLYFGFILLFITIIRHLISVGQGLRLTMHSRCSTGLHDLRR